MKYGTVCSGIGAPEYAWSVISGWKCAWCSEIDKFPSEVLAHYYPETINLGDIRNVKSDTAESIGLLCGGTPCQDFSVAGARAGMDGERSSLVTEYIRILRELHPRWFIWENVPGVLSSSSGRDFRGILRAFEACGYGCVWRVLDVQYVRVDGYVRAIPQRRERVFVVGYFGDWRPAAAILFEPTGVLGNTAPSREAEERVAGTVKGGAKIGGELNNQYSISGRAEYKNNLPTIRACGGDLGGGSERLVLSQYGEIAGTINARNDSSPCADRGMNVIAFNWQKSSASTTVDASTTVAIAQQVYGQDGDPCGDVMETPTRNEGMSANDTSHMVQPLMRVRRFTPVEVERLFGFPDNYTLIPRPSMKGKLSSDAARYKALGNSMGVNVMRWLGRRIELMEAILNEKTA